MDDGEIIPYSDMCQIMLARIRAHAMTAGDKSGRPDLCPRVLDAFQKVPRHDYVPEMIQFFAYMDSPLPIGHRKTISQPYLAALMTDLLRVEAGHRVLEVGTGLGFHAAVLAEMGAHVFTIEIVEELARDAEKRLNAGDYGSIRFKVGDGNFGWPEEGPFDRIIVTAGTELLPPRLLSQLRPGGRMVLPCAQGDTHFLTIVDKSLDGKISIKESLQASFASLEGDLTQTALG